MPKQREDALIQLVEDALSRQSRLHEMQRQALISDFKHDMLQLHIQNKANKHRMLVSIVTRHISNAWFI